MYQKIRIPLICSISAIASLILATSNDRELETKSFGTLTVEQATLFYWSSFVFFASIAVLAIVWLRRSKTLSEKSPRSILANEPTTSSLSQNPRT